jgi:penicillin-binding protein-related factor A (putative recombinase)
MNAKYSEKGSADILGIWSGYFLAIECKSEKGRVSEHQDAWLKVMASLGAICIVARSLEDVIMALGEEKTQGHPC